MTTLPIRLTSRTQRDTDALTLPDTREGIHLFERQLGDDEHFKSWITTQIAKDETLEKEDVVKVNIDNFARRYDMEECSQATFYMVAMNDKDTRKKRPIVKKVT